MNIFKIPWVELCTLVPLIGAIVVSRVKEPYLASRFGKFFTASTLLCALLAAAAFYDHGSEPVEGQWQILSRIFGQRFLSVDELSAPLLPMLALLHFLTALATARTKMRRFSFAWSLFAESLRQATFSCTEPWLLIGLLSIGTLPALIELLNRGKPTRVYLLHLGLFVSLLIVGWAFVEPGAGRGSQTALATVPLLFAILIRTGVWPLHCWITDWFENASFGNAVLFVAPLAGVYSAVRLVLPIAPDWLLQSLGLLSLFTAVYASGMAVVQREARRFFAYLFLSHASLVLVGLELVGRDNTNAIALTGALSLWISVSLSMTGFGLTLRALEARFGRLTLTQFHGYYERSPALAICFLLTGLGGVGFPGTLGYVATEVLVDGSIGINLYIGVAVIVAGAINGIAVVRAYFLLFTGTRHYSAISLNIGLRERIAVLTLAALILGGGLLPQLNVASRHQAAEAVLKTRQLQTGKEANPRKQDD